MRLTKGTTNPFFNRSQDSRWRQYSDRKNAYIRANPEATSKQIDAVARRIARELGL